MIAKIQPKSLIKRKTVQKKPVRISSRDRRLLTHFLLLPVVGIQNLAIVMFYGMGNFVDSYEAIGIIGRIGRTVLRIRDEPRM